ncbi:MAG: hypothetical protein ACI31S_00260 [Bacilli bacterium]
MKKGKSNYSITFNTDIYTINNLIYSYLQSSGFSMYDKKGEKYYRAGDAMLGYRGFNYSINGQTLTIEAWLDGALGDFPLEQNSLNVTAMNYRNSLNTLFQEIEKLNNGGENMNNQTNNQMNFDSNTGESINNQQTQVNNNFTKTFQDENIKKKEKMCEIGFWLSILGLVCSFFGVAYGVIIYIMDFYFASQGLKTRKRGKAITTIILSIISILIIIFSLIIANI